MSNNLVITIGRSFGSGGREIGKKLAEELDMAYYDKEILEEVAKQSGLDGEYIKLFDEKRPPLAIFSSMPIGISGDERQMEVKIQTLQHQVMESLAEKGPCVFIGRRADLILRGRPNTCNIFITAPLEYCIRRVSLRDGLTEQESSEKIRRMNRSRKSFYNYTGEGRWGEASNYNLCIDSGALGTDGTVSLIKSYIELYENARYEFQKNANKMPVIRKW